MNISGVVVRTKAENTEAVVKSLQESGLCEVHQAEDNGKIIITIEGTSIKDETEKLKQIQALPHVVSADMAYAYSDQDFKESKVTPDGVK